MILSGMFGAGGGVGAGDPYLAYNKLLLNMEGADASTTFTDSSSLAHTMTANGNAQIDTSLGYNSGLFDGSGDYVSTPYVKADFDWWTTDYTLEAWIYISTLADWHYTDGTEISSMIGCAVSTSTANYWSFGPIGGGVVRMYYYNGAAQSVTSASAVSTGSLQHIAMTKTASGIYIGVNGTVTSPVAVSGTPQSSESGFYLLLGQINNRSINGHVVAARIKKGVGLYTSSYTPPDPPFPTS